MFYNCIHACMNGRPDAWTDAGADRGMDECMDVWTDGWTVVWGAGIWTDGQIYGKLTRTRACPLHPEGSCSITLGFKRKYCNYVRWSILSLSWWDRIREPKHMGPHYRWKHTCCTQWEGDWAHGTPLSMKTHLVYSMRRRLSTWDPTLDENTPAVLNEKETEHMGPHYRWKHTCCTQWEGDWAHGTPLSMKTHLVYSMRRRLSTWDPTLDENTPAVLNEKETEHMGPHYRWKHTWDPTIDVLNEKETEHMEPHSRWKHTWCDQWEGDWAHGTPLSMKTHLLYSMRRRLSTWDPTIDENTPAVLNEKETEHMGPHSRWKHTWCTQWEGDWAHGTPLSMKTHLVYSMRRRLSTWDPTIDYRKHTWCTQWEGDWAHGTPLSMKTHLMYSMRRRLSTWDPTIDENTPGVLNEKETEHMGPHYRWKHTCCTQWEGDWAHGTPLSMKTHLLYSMRRRLSTWDPTIDESTPAVLNEKETEHMGPHYRWKHTWCTQWEGDWAHGTPLSMKTHLVYSMRRRLSTWNPTLDENTPGVINEKGTEHMGPHYRWKHTWCTQWEGDWAHGTPLSMKTHLLYSMRRRLSTWDPTIDENTPAVLNEKETEHMGPHSRWKHTWCTQWEGDWAHGTPLSMKTHLVYSMRRRLSTWDPTIDENTPGVLNEKETEHMGPHYRWKHTWCTQWEGDWAHGTPLSMKTHLVYSMRRRLSTWDPTIDENTPGVLNEKETEHMGPHSRWKHTCCTQWEGD